MRTSKLLELAALLKQYADVSPPIRAVMAQSLAKDAETEARIQEHRAQEQQCDTD